MIPGRDIAYGVCVGVQHCLFAQKISQSLYWDTSVCHGVVNYFPGLCCMGISDAIFIN